VCGNSFTTQLSNYLPLTGGTITGNLIVNSSINANGNSLVFPNTLADFKITLWQGFGFGVQGDKLKYTSGSGANHKFYSGSTNTFTIDGLGNTSCIGGITASTITTANIANLNGGANINGLSVLGSASFNSTLSTPQIATSTYNNLLAKSIEMYPFSNTGGAYNNGYWLIDVQDYCNQAGFVYLFLNINAPSFLYWQGRVVIANSSSINFYNDMAYNVNLTLISSFGRLKIVVSCLSGTNNGFQVMYIKIMG
jgi:hypothetical protein